MKNKINKSNIFAIDTSTAKLSVALYANNSLHSLTEITSDHSEMLTIVLDKLLKKSRIKLQDINILAVNTGPGSFTGLRVGLSFIRTIAESYKFEKIVTTNSFLMLLYEAKQYIQDKTYSSSEIVTLFPSVKNEFYYCRFRLEKGDAKKVSEESYAEIDEVMKLFCNKKTCYFVIPEGMIELDKINTQKIIKVKFSSDTIIKIFLNDEKFFYSFTSPEKLTPFYLRHTYY